MDGKISVSFCQSPGTEMPNVCLNLENEYFSNAQDAGKSGNMSVFARIRPMLQKEEDDGFKECIGAIDDMVVRAVVPKSSVKFKNSNHNGQEIFEDFKYTQAFGPEVGQFKFFEQTIMSTMQSFIEGQNCLVFSYGITNSGKTYTLQGDENNPGIIILGLKLFFASIEHQLLIDVYAKPDKFSDVVVVSEHDVSKEIQLKDSLLRIYHQEVANKTTDSFANKSKSFASSLCELFSQKHKQNEVEATLLPEEMEAAQSAELMRVLCKESADKQVGKCNIWISFIEIYNEYIYDLLQPFASKRKTLQVAEDQHGDVYIKGATEVCVSDVDEALKLLLLGRRNLRIASTKLNYQSSRSHCIYNVKVVRFDEDMSSARVNRLSFCDLAGSERASKSDTSGMRLKEASYINTSLLVLGRCMEQLRLNQSLRDKKMIPLRESKLTRIFSGHFLGKGKAVMIANASPCEYTFDETLNVLRFSALAKELILNDSYITMASNSLQSISSQWAQSRAQVTSFSLDESSDMDNSLLEEIQSKDEMIEKLLDLADSLRTNLEKEKKEKAQLEISIRQDVVKDYAEWSDKHIAELRAIHDEQMEDLKEIYNKRLLDAEKQKDARIKELRQQLDEYLVSSDESFKSTDENTNSDIKDIESMDLTAEQALRQSNKFDLRSDEVLNFVEKTNHEIHSNVDVSNDLERYVEENKVLKLDLTSLKNQLDMSLLEAEKSSEEIIKLQTEIEQHKDQISSLTSELDSISSVSNERYNEFEKLSTDMITLREDVNNVSSELNATKQELEHTAMLLAESQTNESSAQNKCVDLESKLQEALQVLEEYEKDIASLKSAVSTAENKSVELMEAKQIQQDTIFSLSEQLASATDRNKELTETVQDAEKAVLEENNKSKKSLEGLTENFNEQIKKYDQLQTQYEILEKSNAYLSEKYNTLEEDYNKLSKDLISANMEISSLKEALMKSEELYATLQDSNMKNDPEAEKLKEETTKVINEQKTKISSLEAECAAYKMESSSLLCEISAFVKEKLALTADCEKFQSELVDLQKSHDELTNQMNSEKIEADKKATEMKAELEQLNLVIVEKEAEYESLKASHANCNILEDNLNNMRISQEKAKKENEDLKSKLEETSQVLCEEKSIVASLELKYEQNLMEYSNLLANYDKLEEQMALRNTDLENVKNEFEITGQELCVLKEKIEDINLKLEETNIIVEQHKACPLKSAEKDQLNDSETSVNEFNHSAEFDKSFNGVSQTEELESMVDTYKSKIVEMEIDCKNHMNEYNNVLKSYKELEVIFNKLYEETTLKMINEEKAIDEIETTKQEMLFLTEKYEDLRLKLDQAHSIMEQRKLIPGKSADEDNLNDSNTSVNELNNSAEFDKSINEVKQNGELVVLDTYKSKISEMEVECKNHMTEYTNVLENYKNLELKFNVLSEEMDIKLNEVTESLGEKNEEILKLQNECTLHQEDFSKLKEINESLKETCSDLKIKLDAAKVENFAHEQKEAGNTSTLTQLDSSLKKWQEECSKYGNIMENLQAEKKVLQEECSNHEKIVQNYQEEKKVLKEECSNYEKIIRDFKEEKESLEDKCNKLINTEAALKEEMKEINIKLENSTSQIKELQEQKLALEISSSAQSEEITKHVVQLEKNVEKFTIVTEEINQLKEEKQILSDKLEESLLETENQVKLIEVLQLNEIKATEKIQSLQAASKKCLEEVEDMQRQICEKETSIAELEKGLCDTQQQMRDLKAENQKQIFALKEQHEIEVTESIQLKSDTEKENQQLKNENSKLVKQIKEKVDEIDALKVPVLSVSKEKRKKKTSALSKSENNSDEKENSDSNTESLKEAEKTTNSKRPRRALRSRQPESTFVVDESDSDAKPIKSQSRKRKSSDEFMPAKKTQKKQPGEKKPTLKKVPRMFPNKNVQKENTENMSPVQKITAFMGSKFRNVAESISNMPSPRVTRQRKKLFNVDASSSATKSWKF